MQSNTKRQTLWILGVFATLITVGALTYTIASSFRPTVRLGSEPQPISPNTQTGSIPLPVTGGGPELFLPFISGGPANADPPKPTGTDPVLIGAGDIARCNVNGDDLTAAIIRDIPGTVMAIGDTAYDNGSSANYKDCYDPTWGQFKDRTRPAVGNHEYMTSGASAYQAYFSDAAGPAGKFYYSYDLGTWHVIVLNSECSNVPGGCGSGSPQETWLKQDLANHPNRCTLAYFHEPLYSSGEHGNDTGVKTFWQDLYSAGVELVLNGHDHDYERFTPMDPNGTVDNAKGIRQIVVGSGGGVQRPWGKIKNNSVARINNVYGVIELTLHDGSYDWKFLPQAGKTDTDSGTDICH